MAERNHKVGEAIQFIYQAPNRESGATIVGEIYLPTGAKDSNFPDVTLTERATTGTYVGSFTPNAAGEWEVIVHKDNGDGQVARRYSVGNYNLEAVGDQANNIVTAVGNVDAQLDDVEGKVDIVDAVVDGMDTQLDIVEGKIDSIDGKVSALDTPPMIS